jgi:hypothetical protein
VVEPAQTEDTEEETNTHSKTPEASLTVHFVQKGVVNQEAE